MSKTYTSADFAVSKYPLVDEVTDFDAERLIVVGDVHGCIVELAALLKAADPGPRDRIVFLGDLLDRGPAGAETVETVRELCLTRPRTHCVLGNHEEKHVRFRKWRHLGVEAGKKNPMNLHPTVAAIHDSLSDEAVAWLAGLPAVVSMQHGHVAERPQMNGPVTLMTHAGLLPQNPLRQETKGLIRNRFVTQSAKGWSPANMNKDWSAPANSVIWDEAWSGRRVIYGHIVHSLTDIRVVNDCWGIDTGCCFGGRLTAYIEDLRTGVVDIQQVRAQQVYFDKDRTSDE